MAAVESKNRNKPVENCGRCGKNARTGGIEYCQRCLCAVIEKRVKRELAAAGAGSGRRDHKRAKLAILCDGKSSLQCAAAAYLVKKVYRPVFGVEIITSESTAQLQENATAVLPKCADDIAAEFMEKFISPETGSRYSQRLRLPLRKIGAINIFEAVTEKELALYADIKSLKYAKTKGRAKKDGLRQGIQKLQARYPGTIEALARSGRRIEGFFG